MTNQHPSNCRPRKPFAVGIGKPEIITRPQSYLSPNDEPGRSGITRAEATRDIADMVLPGSPEALFWHWAADNAGRLKEAVIELGLEPPEPGPDLLGRIRDLVIPVLLARKHGK